MNDAVAEVERPPGMSGDVLVVGDEHDCHSAQPAEPIEEVEDLLAGDGVECPGRLVGEQQPWVVCERPRDRDALSLAA